MKNNKRQPIAILNYVTEFIFNVTSLATQKFIYDPFFLNALKFCSH